MFRVTSLARVTPGSYEARFPTVGGAVLPGIPQHRPRDLDPRRLHPDLTGDGCPAAWPFTPVPVAGEPTRFIRVAVARDAVSFPVTLP